MARAFLSAKTIITTSYHGAYWAMLLKRQVLLYRPRWNKLRYFKYHPHVCDEDNYKSKCTGELSAPANFLDECRSLNLDFYNRVTHYLR